MASDIPIHGQIINNENLTSQKYLNEINEWTEQHKMKINAKKTKAMIFNFTHNHQFTTRLLLNDEKIEVVEKMKILGTIVKNNLSWDDNCQHLIKKVNARMQLLRGVLSFGASNEEMVHLWILFCRSVLEQSCVLWHNSLTQENIEDLERTQKSFTKMVLKDKYIHYESSLMKLNIENLQERRTSLCLKFAKSGIKNDKMNYLFPLSKKEHKMETRDNEKFQVNFSNTERLKNSSIPCMQNYLNTDEKQAKRRKYG